MALKFQVKNKLETKNKKESENKKTVTKKPIEKREALVNTISAPTSLSSSQLRKNYEASSKAVDISKSNIANYLQSQGIKSNKSNPYAQTYDSRDTLLKTAIAKGTTPNNRANLYTANNASEILQSKVEQRKQAMSSDIGEQLKNSLRIDTNTRNIEHYNYNLKQVESDKTKFGDRTVGSLWRGITTMFDNMGDSYTVTDDKGNTEKLASYGQLKQDKVNSESNLPQRLVSNTLFNMGKVLASNAINTATFGVGGSAIYWGDNFFDTYYENVNQGYDKDSSAKSSFVTTGVAMVLDKLLGAAAVNTVGRKFMDGIAQEEIKGLDDILAKQLTNKGLSKGWAKLFASMGAEGISEATEEYVDAFINKYELDKEEDASEYISLLWKTFLPALEAGTVGALSGGIGALAHPGDLKALNNLKEVVEDHKPTSVGEAKLKEKMLVDIEDQIEEIKVRGKKHINKLSEEEARYVSKKTQTSSEEVKSLITKEEYKKYTQKEKQSADYIESQFNKDEKTKQSTEERDIALRRMKQGTSTELVEGGLKSDELKQLKKEQNKISKGDIVEIDSKKAKVVSDSHNGKAYVEYEDGTKDQVLLKNMNKELTEGSYFKYGEKNKYFDALVREENRLNREKISAEKEAQLDKLPQKNTVINSRLKKESTQKIRNYLGKIDDTRLNNISKENLSYVSDITNKLAIKENTTQTKIINKYLPNNAADIKQKLNEAKKAEKTRSYLAEKEKALMSNIIRNQGKKLNYSDQQIKEATNKANALIDMKNTKQTTLSEAMKNNAIVIKKGSILKADNEADINNVMKLAMPTDKKVSITLKTLPEQEVKLVKPSQNFFKDVKTNEELFDKLESNKTQKQKTQETKERYKKERMYERRQNWLQKLNESVNGEDAGRLSDYEKSEMDHMFKSVSLEDVKTRHLEQVYRDVDGLEDSFNEDILTRKISDDTTSKAFALMTYYDEKGLYHLSDTVYERLSGAMTHTARALGVSRIMYQDTPMGAYMSYMRSIDQAYKEDSRYHQGDAKWIAKNRPFNDDGSINFDSPYRLSDEVKDNLGSFIQQWYDIKDSNSKEAKIKQKQINDLLRDNLPKESFTKRAMDWRRSAMLNSLGVWIKNSRQELVDVSGAVITDITSTPADKYLEKLRNNIEKKAAATKGEDFTEKRYRTTSISTIGVGKFISGYAEGAKNHWNEVMNDVSLNRTGSKYDEVNSNSVRRVDNIGNVDRKKYNVVTGFIAKSNALGMSADTRFASGFDAVSLYDQQSQFAKNMAANTGNNAVVRTECNESGSVITYVDAETMKTAREIIPSITEKQQLLDYMKNKKYELPSEKDIETMLERADQIGKYRTLQDKSAVTQTTGLILKKIDDISIKYLKIPVGSTITPFYSAMTESVRTFVKFTPLAAIDINNKINQFKLAVEDNAKGTANNNLFDIQYSLSKDIGQCLGGTLAAIIGGVIVNALNDNGVLISNKKDEKKGEQEYSIKIGDKYYSYDIGTVLSTGVKYLSILTEKENIEMNKRESIVKNIEKTLSNYASPMFDTLIEQTAIASFAEYFNEKYGTTFDNIMYKVSSIPSSYIPTLLKNIAVSMDGFRSRDISADTNLGRMITNCEAKIPGFRSMLDTKKDKWKNEEDVGLGILDKIWNTMIAKEVSSPHTTNIDKELYDLYKITNSTDMLPTQGIKKNFTYGEKENKKTYYLNSEEGDKYRTTYAKTAYKTLDSLFKTKAYKNASDKDRASLVRAAYNYADQKAQYEYLSNKNIAYDVKQSVIKKVIEQDISLSSAQYQIKNPERWKLYDSIYKDYDVMKNINDRIKEIKDTYSTKNGFSYKTKKKMVSEYVAGLQGMNAVQKAMLIKLSGFQSSYSSYDKQINAYIKSLGLSNKEYEYFISESNLGLKGYYIYLHKDK